jgi:hypothetical protein
MPNYPANLTEETNVRKQKTATGGRHGDQYEAGDGDWK